MQAEVIYTLQAWVLSVLLYPGLLFALLLVVVGEWVAGLIRPSLSRRIQRSPVRHAGLVQPVYTFFKLAGRQRPSLLGPEAHSGLTRTLADLLAVVGAVAPVLALALMPLPGSPVTTSPDYSADLVLVLALLLVQPLLRAFLRLRAGGLVALRGAQDLARLLAGALPALLVIAALVEVSGTRTLQLASLEAAPETGSQFFVRLLGGVALLAAFPWWLDSHRHDTAEGETAALYSGAFLQQAALAVLWSVLVLPRPGDMAWAAGVAIGGSLFAYVVIRVVARRWAPARREKDSAGLMWATALPASLAALALAFWIEI